MRERDMRDDLILNLFTYLFSSYFHDRRTRPSSSRYQKHRDTNTRHFDESVRPINPAGDDDDDDFSASSDLLHAHAISLSRSDFCLRRARSFHNIASRRHLPRARYTKHLMKCISQTSRSLPLQAKEDIRGKGRYKGRCKGEGYSSAKIETRDNSIFSKYCISQEEKRKKKGNTPSSVVFSAYV